MPYEGDILNACGVIDIDFSESWIVAVSGDGPNVCGHLLVYTAPGGGYYFHVTAIRREAGYSAFAAIPCTWMARASGDI